MIPTKVVVDTAILATGTTTIDANWVGIPCPCFCRRIEVIESAATPQGLLYELKQQDGTWTGVLRNPAVGSAAGAAIVLEHPSAANMGLAPVLGWSAQNKPSDTYAIGTTYQIGSTTLDSTGSAAATVVGAGTGVYTVTLPGGAASGLAGQTVTMAGFGTAANNGTFTISASNATTITTNNAASANSGAMGTCTLGTGSAFVCLVANTIAVVPKEGTTWKRLFNYRPADTIIRLMSISATPTTVTIRFYA